MGLRLMDRKRIGRSEGQEEGALESGVCGFQDWIRPLRPDPS